MISMEGFGQLPYDVGYQKKHIRPHGGGWEPAPIPRTTITMLAELFLQGKILCFFIFAHYSPQNVFRCVFNHRQLPR